MTSFHSRRRFIKQSSLLAASTLGTSRVFGEESSKEETSFPIIDLHQHTRYSGRSDSQLRTHQQAMGISRTVLLPAGKYYGLAASCGGNETVYRMAELYPDDFVFFANEVPDLPMAHETIEKYLKLGAVGIGEQKFELECDSKPLERVASLAADYEVPVLIHFQHRAYNTSLERFHTVLEKFPKTNFIGHAQTWWGNIDKKHRQSVMYPTGPVTPGGITDRLLTDYPNMYGDMSAGSGLNALRRDEAHTREFLKRHQDKLIFGSDCNDRLGRGPGCQGTQTIRTVHRLAGDDAIRSKLFYQNAQRLMRL